MSRGNQRVQLPQIQQKQQAENYNFITSKKKTVQFQQPLPQDDFLEDWKKKCEDLQRDVETRNQTIFSIQRNFESLSALLKTEKQENMGIKDEVMRLRDLLQQQQSQERDNSIKIADSLKKIKELSQYQDLLAEERKNTQKQAIEISNLKNQVSQLETIIRRKESEIHQMSGNLSSLQLDLAQLPSLQQDNVKLSQSVENMQEIIARLEKSLTDKELNLQIAFKNNTQLNSLIENLKLDISAAQGMIKHLKTEENISLSKIAKQQQEIADYQSQIKIFQDQLNNQNTVLQTRNQQDGQQSQAIQMLQKQILEQQKQYQILIKENANLSEFINENMHIIEQYQQVLTVFGNTNFIDVIKDHQKLLQENKIKQEKLEISQQELLRIQQQLQQNQQDQLSLKNQVSSLQKQNQELNQKCQYFEDELKVYQSLKSSSTSNEQMLKSLSVQLKHKSESELSLLNQIKSLQNEITQYCEYDGLIMSYKKYTQPVEFIVTSELNELKENIQQITQSNQLYVEDISSRNEQIEKLNNQLLQLDDLNNLINILRSDELQLKMKLDTANQQIVQLSKENKTHKIMIDSQETQIVAANKENRNLSQQVFEQMENLQSLNAKNSGLQKELNQNQDVSYKMGLDIKNLTAKCKKAEEELEMLNPDKLRGLQLQLEQKEKEFQSQLTNIALALDSQIMSISCNSCMEVLSKTITCYPCGHSFCEKCFKNGCTECQNQDGWFKNKRMDDLISKINYSKEILNTYKKKQ